MREDKRISSSLCVVCKQIVAIFASKETKIGCASAKSSSKLGFLHSACTIFASNNIYKSKGYEYSKLDNVDVSALDDELLFRSRGGYYVKYNSNELMVLDSKDAVVYTKEGEFTYESTVEPLVGTMEAIGHHVKVEKLEKE